MPSFYLKPCIPGTRLPQHSHSDVQSTQNTDTQTAADQQPPGTNMELLDIDDDDASTGPQAEESPVNPRYPQHANRQPPHRFDNFVSY